MEIKNKTNTVVEINASLQELIDLLGIKGTNAFLNSLYETGDLCETDIELPQSNTEGVWVGLYEGLLQVSGRKNKEKIILDGCLGQSGFGSTTIAIEYTPQIARDCVKLYIVCDRDQVPFDIDEPLAQD